MYLLFVVDDVAAADVLREALQVRAHVVVGLRMLVEPVH
jgi:hypothetical protein